MVGVGGEIKFGLELPDSEQGFGIPWKGSGLGVGGQDSSLSDLGQVHQFPRLQSRGLETAMLVR